MQKELFWLGRLGVIIPELEQKLQKRVNGIDENIVIVKVRQFDTSDTEAICDCPSNYRKEYVLDNILIPSVLEIKDEYIDFMEENRYGYYRYYD